VHVSVAFGFLSKPVLTPRTTSSIHQPSAELFQEFDRLLLLRKGGQTVYFGDIGENSTTLINYFQKSGGYSCPPDANPYAVSLLQEDTRSFFCSEPSIFWMSSGQVPRQLQILTGMACGRTLQRPGQWTKNSRLSFRKAESATQWTPSNTLSFQRHGYTKSRFFGNVTSFGTGETPRTWWRNLL